MISDQVLDRCDKKYSGNANVLTNGSVDQCGSPVYYCGDPCKSTVEEWTSAGEYIAWIGSVEHLG